jgi:maltooligosyltrehalose trehalohydrolase
MIARRYAQGAEVTANGVSFRVWAPEKRRVDLVLHAHDTAIALDRDRDRDNDGFWSVLTDLAAPGDLYSYRLNGETQDYPDLAARYLPDGPHGPAQVIDPAAFAWTDHAWSGVSPRDHVIYELHIGTFSPEGTWAGAEAKLSLLKELGVTTVEIMPVAEFDGDFGWGYDGVAWFAPSHLYGVPDGLRHLVNSAHGLGLAVILDVVYNHFGPSGNYTSKFARFYTGDVQTEWGPGLNYDGAYSHGMRSLAIDNAAYWIDEFHLDGLRLDATQAISDRSDEHVISAIAKAARAAGKGRNIFLVGENEPQDARQLRQHKHPGVGSGLNGLWNDDFHHTVKVALTGRRQAYFSDYSGQAHEWLATIRSGFIFQGQRSKWQGTSRGHPTQDISLRSFICFLENHDQVANSLWNTRLWQQCMPAQHRAMTALLLLGPWTPMLFQGQEWNSSAPFRYVAGFSGELAALVRRGRTEFLSQFPGCAAHPEIIRDCSDRQSLEECRLHWSERSLPDHARALRLHRDLLHLRDQDPTLGKAAPSTVRLVGAIVNPRCMILRYYFNDALQETQRNDRLLLVNLGQDFEIERITEPLLTPPIEAGFDGWRTQWCSEDPAYGGHGCGEPYSTNDGWLVPAAATVLLAPAFATSLHI